MTKEAKKILSLSFKKVIYFLSKLYFWKQHQLSR